MASPSTNTPRGILINRNTDSHHNAEDAHQREVIRYPFSDTEESTEDIRSPNEGPSSLGSQYSSRLRPTEDADDSEGVPDEVLDEAARSLKNEIVIMSGYLLKKGEKRRTWKKRWFVLRPTRLAYYQNDKEYELLNIIKLSDIHAIADVELKRRQNVFGLVTRERTFYMQAFSPEDMQDWMRALRSAHRHLTHQNERTSPTSPPRRASHANTATSATVPTPVQLPQPVVTDDANSQQSSIITADSFQSNTTTPSSIFSTYAQSNADSTTSTVIPYVPTPSTAQLPSRAPRPTSIQTARSPTGPSSRGSTPSAVRPDISSSDEEFEEEPEMETGILADNRVVKEGYLEKRVTNNYKKLATTKGWRKRWFVLRNARLCTYKNDGEYVVKRLYPLRSVLDILEIDPQGKHHLHCFKIVLPKRQLILCAPNEGEMVEWIKALRSVHQVVRRKSARQKERGEEVGGV